MNINNYREFLSRIGYHVIKSDSGCWFNLGPAFYENIPPFATINPAEDEVLELVLRHRMMGIKYCTATDDAGKPSFFYVCKDKAYDLSSIQPRMRNTVRRGLKKCQVCQIDFEYLQAHGLPLNRDTLARQQRADPIFSQAGQWQRFCQAANQIEGALTWGAFVGNELAAYMVAFVIDGYGNYLHQMSRTDLLESHANHALTYFATKELLSCSSISGVIHGQESVRDLAGIDAYKVRMGYERQPIYCVVKLHPVVKSVMLSRAGQVALKGIRHLLPGNDFLLRASGIVNIARHS